MPITTNLSKKKNASDAKITEIKKRIPSTTGLVIRN